MTEKYQIVIVGAGISGLSAAKTLIENGITDVKIIEAQSYAGGRIRSEQVGDYLLELGAQWLHGVGNEIFDICQENDLLTNEYSAEGEGLYLRENGEVIDQRVVEEVDKVVTNILENCENYASCDSVHDIPTSVGHELLLKFNEYLKDCNDSEHIKAIKYELLDWHIRYHLIDNSCSDLNKLSAKSWGIFKHCGGNEYINIKNGYSSLVEYFVNSLPKDTIIYNTVVQRIEWVENTESDSCTDYHVCNICTNGVNYLSRYVIVTSSLGYLKHNYQQMFSPPLPRYLAQAIEFLDFGVMNKVFLIYDKPWWEKDTRGFQLVWSFEESSFPPGHWGRSLTGFDVILKEKPLLMGWIGGEGAKAVEELTEDEVGKESTHLLRYFTKNQNIPLPKKVILTKWWTNEFVRGAYSNIPISCDEPDINTSSLLQPVCTKVKRKENIFEKPTILLAGESTHKSHYSTVHGAYESGQIQAQVIINDIKESKSD